MEIKLEASFTTSIMLKYKPNQLKLPTFHFKYWQKQFEWKIQKSFAKLKFI